MARRLLPDGIDVSANALQFVIETYAALAARIAGAVAVAGTDPFSGGSLRLRLAELESGELLAEHGVAPGGDDVFCWVPSVFSEEISDGVRRIVDVWERVLRETGPARDLLGPLHAAFLPTAARRRLGEYYTPDALAGHAADLALARSGEKMSFCDPTCGSGAFLVQAIDRFRRHTPDAALLAKIGKGLAGYDVSPLAVVLARANVLIALRGRFGSRPEPFEPPVWRRDAILDPPDRRFDVIAGNPPWLNWEGLPPAYRERTRFLWEHYGLFPHRGMDAILGKGKKDLSMLAFLSASDRMLESGGRIAMVLPRSLLQSAGAGAGFRRFVLPSGSPAGPVRVADWTAAKPFGAGRGTVVLVCDKGRGAKFPVRWDSVADDPGGPTRHEARPVDRSDRASAWIVVPKGTWSAFRRVLGKSPYKAHAGAYSGGANGVYWMRRTGPSRDGVIPVQNDTATAKRAVPRVETTIEDALLYPLLRAGGVDQWTAATDGLVLVPQDPVRRRGIDAGLMAEKHPLTLAYLERFENVLRSRPALARYFSERDPFWSVFDVGEYTFSPWKVVWPSMARDIRAAVAGPVDGRPVVPQHTLTLVAVRGAEEAHYLCGALNCGVPGRVARAFSSAGSKGFACPHVLDRIAVPRFDRDDPLHRRIADLSRAAHEHAKSEERDRLAETLGELRTACAPLWGLEPGHATAIVNS